MRELLREQEDEFTDAAFASGALGVAEDLKFIQRDLRYDPDLIATPTLTMQVFFAEAPSEATRLALVARFPQAQFILTREPNRDWLEEWKKGFVPFEFSKPFWVVPAWLTPPAELINRPQHIIFVEPGMAFGTGTHETTRLAAGILLEEIGRKPARSLLDVGTGTGILALVAARMGVEKVVGIDNDPEARRAGRENLARNTVGDRVTIVETQLAEMKEQFELVVANIIDGVLLILAGDLRRVLRPGGRLILSGVLTDREDEFYAKFQAATGLVLLNRRRDGEWSAAILGEGDATLLA